MSRPAGPCPCECNAGRECGACGHAGCGQVAGWTLMVVEVWRRPARRAARPVQLGLGVPMPDAYGTDTLDA